MERVYTKDLHSHIDKEVRLSGWVDVRRDHGKLIFIDLRDFTGKVQMVAIPNNKEAHEKANVLRAEWVISVTGVVKNRPEKMVNSDSPNGDIEFTISQIEVLTEANTPPFDVTSDGHEIGEEHRLEYRYLDLRRPRMQKNIRNRHKVISFIRNYLTKLDFVEIETPILTKSTPEGARDYIVPSRVDKGKFYALPQSPQQFKQLLMAAGFEKYFQIARCMRDEDTRGDRQPEFTQLDIEMSFVTQEEILDLTESMYTKLVGELYPEKTFTETPWPRIDYKEAMEKYGSDKPDIRKDKNDKNELGFVWILNFPLFEEDMENGNYAPSHHMFTAPKTEDVSKLNSKPEEVQSYQHDLALNGYEIAGGSIRVHQPDIQNKIFDLIGFSKEQKDDFEHMIKAFTFGIPPHGGIAPGIDRFLMILENEPSIREVISFPKTGEGRDLMMGAPETVEEKQLNELGIHIEKKK